MNKKQPNKVFVVIGVVCIVLGLVLPFFLTIPVTTFICNVQGLDGWCGLNAPLVFFGILVLFTFLGALAIYTSLARKKNSFSSVD